MGLEVADLLSAGGTSERLDRLRAGGSVDEADLDALLDEAEDLLHRRPHDAEELALLVEAASPDRWPALRGRARYQRARLHAERGELLDALRLIAEARGLWLESGDDLAGLRTDLGRMQVLDDLGRHAEAVEVGAALIDAVGRLPAGDAPLARRVVAHAVDNVGAAYGYLGRHTLALQAYAEAERAYRELGMADVAARPLANRAVELLALGRPREAVGHLRRANEAFLSAGDVLFAAQCQGDLATAHQQLGEFTEALALLEPARRTLDDLGAHAEADRLRLALAETYLAVGLVPQAHEAATESAERTERAGMVHDGARARYLLGQSHLLDGDPAAARVELTRAAAAFAEVADRHYLARTGLALAEADALDGRPAAAYAAAEAAAADLATGGWRSSLAWAYLRMSDWSDDEEQAAGLIDQAGMLVDHLRLPDLSFAHQLRSARRHRRQGEVARAEEVLREAITALDRASAALADYVVRTAFRTDRFAAHDELVDLLLERGEPVRACAVADEVKARTLRELQADAVGTGPDLTGQDASGPGVRTGPVDGEVDSEIDSEIDSEVDKEIATAYADLNATYAALHRSDDGATRILLREQADTQERRVAGLRLRRAAAPASAPVGAVVAVGPAVDVDALAYHVLGDDVVVFGCHAGQVTARRLTGAVPRLREELAELRVQWARCRHGAAYGERSRRLLLVATKRSLAALYDLLVRPVEDLLDVLVTGDPDEPDLRIVPHGLIGEVPFQALFDGERTLLDRTAVTVAPTLVCVDGRAPLDRPAVVVAAPDDAIPAAADEAADVVAQLACRLGAEAVHGLVGADATADAVTAALAGAGLVHLACHAVYRAENPLFSRLRLHDRWLTTAEIVRLDLPGALVTLSACESGRHGHTAEPVGLGWAFLAAGAAGVVVSRWTVDDATARSLMSSFYRELLTGRSPAAALRRAQLELARTAPHPYYWAPFTFLAAPATPVSPPEVPDDPA